MTLLARHHQIHGVQPVLLVPDVAAAAAWFVRVLGFQIDFLHGEPEPGYGRVKLGDRSWGDPVYICLAGAAGDIRPSGATRLHVGHDIDGLHAHALAQGATVLLPPTNQPWGLREIEIEAPGGHRLVLGAEGGDGGQADGGAHDATSSPRTVIACYRPRPGQAAALDELVRGHVPALQRLGLATDRAAMTLRAADGTVVEIFEWASAAAIAAAHDHPELQALRAAFGECGEHAKLSQLPEAQHFFAEFAPLNA